MFTVIPLDHNLRGSETIAANICGGIPGCLTSCFSLGKNRHLSIPSVLLLLITTCLPNHLQLNIIPVDSPPPVPTPRIIYVVGVELERSSSGKTFKLCCFFSHQGIEPGGHSGIQWDLQALGRFCLAVGPEDSLPLFLGHALES